MYNIKCKLFGSRFTLNSTSPNRISKDLISKSNERNGKAKLRTRKVNDMEQFNTFGEFVVAKRLENNISLRKMAELMDVSAPFWSDVEKGRKNPPKLEKLEQLARILHLTDEDTKLMLDLAGKERNAVAPDIPEYIKQNDYVAAALRTVRDLGASEEDWDKFVEELKKRTG